MGSLYNRYQLDAFGEPPARAREASRAAVEMARLKLAEAEANAAKAAQIAIEQPRRIIRKPRTRPTPTQLRQAAKAKP